VYRIPRKEPADRQRLEASPREPLLLAVDHQAIRGAKAVSVCWQTRPSQGQAMRCDACSASPSAPGCWAGHTANSTRSAERNSLLRFGTTIPLSLSLGQAICVACTRGYMPAQCPFCSGTAAYGLPGLAQGPRLPQLVSLEIARTAHRLSTIANLDTRQLICQPEENPQREVRQLNHHFDPHQGVDINSVDENFIGKGQLSRGVGEKLRVLLALSLARQSWKRTYPPP
jgi:hypothetical protein